MSIIKATIFGVAGFETTANAMAAEQVLLENEVEHIMMPLPTKIAASCGLAVRFWPADVNRVRELFEAEGIKFKLYQGIKDKTQESYEPIA